MQRKGGQRGAADRISALPTALLRRILSFLTTREAARTSVLSRRWRRLWVTAPALSFGIAEFREQQLSWESAERKLVKAVDEVVSQRDVFSDLERLELQLSYPLPCLLFMDPSARESSAPLILSTLVRFAAARNLREVVLGLPPLATHHSRVEMPRQISTCESLRVLELHAGFSALGVAAHVRLPSLQTLRLRSAVFEDDSLQRLVSSCPALEELDMHHVLFHSLHVSAPALRRLAARSFGFMDCKLMVSAPKLRSLEYAPMMCDPECVLLNLDSVEHAVVDVQRIDPPYVVTPTGELLKALFNVRALTLHFWGGPDQYLSPEQELRGRLPTFRNLKRLVLCIWLSEDHVEAIIHILEHAPNVETLEIDSAGPERRQLERRFGRSEGEWGDWTPPRGDSRIALRGLKSIEIKNFEATVNELRFVGYLLEVTAGVLEKMVIIPYKHTGP